MLAVLPKRVSDDLSGELFVAAYQRHLGHYPQEAVNFLAETVTARCRWFPTIAECIEIMGEWRRDDDAVRLRQAASLAAARERRARHEERAKQAALPAAALTQADVDQMDEALIRIGIRGGWIARDADGNAVLVEAA